MIVCNYILVHIPYNIRLTFTGVNMSVQREAIFSKSTLKIKQISETCTVKYLQKNKLFHNEFL